MRNLFLFLPAIAIPLVCLQLSSGQTSSSTAIVNTSQQPLAPFKPLPQTTPVVLKLNTQEPPASPKKQTKKVTAQKHSPKTQAKSSKSKEKTRLYTTPAIQIRVAIAQNVSNIAIASSTAANVIDGNGQRLKQLPPSGAFEVSANNSTILFREVQIPSVLWIEPTDKLIGIKVA